MSPLKHVIYVYRARFKAPFTLCGLKSVIVAHVLCSCVFVCVCVMCVRFRCV